jgi:SAM-dependent methyltransferase
MMGGMQGSRNLSILLNHALNELLPPVIRDSRWLMTPLFKLAFKQRADVFLNFRERAVSMTEAEYQQCYIDIAGSRLVKGSDLNRACLARIPGEMIGSKILEVGCGRGLLAGILARQLDVTACDIVVPRDADHPGRIRFVEASAESLPFEDGAFETVVCTHVLEHVRDLDAALRELRRVASKRLVIVVPRERPYRFGFNLHLSFFPYRFSVLNTIGRLHGERPVDLRLEGGDWFYVEDVSGPALEQ